MSDLPKADIIRNLCRAAEGASVHGTIGPMVKAVIEQLSRRTNWPMDGIAEHLEEAGIDSPRPSEVLQAFFKAIT